MMERTKKKTSRRVMVLVAAAAVLALAALLFAERLLQQGYELTFNGEVVLEDDYTVIEPDTLFIAPGTRVRLGNDVRLIVDGRIVARGTAEEPIVFEASQEGGYWRGIKINGLDDPPDIDAYWRWIERGDNEKQREFFEKIDGGNIFEHCIFRNLATKTRKFERVNKWKGSIEAYNTSLRVSHCRFEDVLYFGGVLVQRARVVANDNTFDDETIHKALNGTDSVVGLFSNNTVRGHRKKNQRCADGIWTKQFVGLAADNTIDTVAARRSTVPLGLDLPPREPIRLPAGLDPE